MAYIKPVTRKDATGKRVATGRWSAQVYFGKDAKSGKTLWRSQTFGTKKEAKDWAAKIETDRNRGTYRPTLGRTTLADYITKAWLPLFKKRCRSWYNTEKTLTKWILTAQPNTPHLGRIPLHKLKATDFSRLYVAMTEKRGPNRSDRPIGPRGIEHLHGLIGRVLNAAVREQELPLNPAKGATLPIAKGDTKPKVMALTEEQEERVISAAMHSRLKALWLLLIDTGVRPGEAFALKWRHDAAKPKDPQGWVEGIDDGDERFPFVKVKATLSRNGVHGGDGWVITDPKTENSSRDIPISAATRKALREWRKVQSEEKRAAGREWCEHGFVFTTLLGAPLGTNVHVEWANLLREADGGRGDLGEWGAVPTRKPGQTGRLRKRTFKPRFRLYVLRHTSATLAYKNGLDLLLVSRRLGHSNTHFTGKTYTHVTAEHTERAADLFQQRFDKVERAAVR